MARRTNTLQIRLTEEELAVVEKLAASEHLPVSTYARRLLLKDAIDKGLFDEGDSSDGAPKKWLWSKDT